MANIGTWVWSRAFYDHLEKVYSKVSYFWGTKHFNTTLML